MSACACVGRTLLSDAVDLSFESRIGPNRSESITATGRAPMVKISRRIPPTQQRFDALVFIQRQAMVTQNFGSNREGCGGHVGKFYCRISRMVRTDEIRMD